MIYIKYIGVIIAIFAVFYGVIWLWYALRTAVNVRKYPDYKKPLSESDQSKIATAKVTIAQYRKAQNYPWHYTALTLGGGVPVTLSIVAVVLFILIILRALSAHIEASAAEGGIMLAPFAVSLLSGGFLGMPLAAIICIYVARAVPRYMSYLTYNLGWGRRETASRDDSDIDNDMNHYARTGQLTLESAKDGPELTRLMFERFTGEWKLFTALLLAITLYTLSWDVRSLTYVTPNSISNIEPNFRSVKTRPLSEIQIVERECYVSMNDGDLKANLSYRLTFKDGHALDIENHNIAKLMSGLNTAQGKFPLNPVEFTVATDLPRAPSLELCEQAIEEDYYPDIHDGLKSAFR